MLTSHVPLAGVRVVEVATHVFAPMAGAILAEWGADVLKVEPPGTGDPYRGLVTTGLHPLQSGVDPYVQSANRGKRSLGIDLKHPEGRDLLGRLVRAADVFVTSLRPGGRARLRIDVEDVRADNPAVVYVRASAFGPRGPEAARGGYDAGAFWARSGMQHVLTPPGAAWPRPAPPAFGDLAGALALAGAVCAALVQRAAGGERVVIDGSLLAAGLWQIQPDIVSAAPGGATVEASPDRYEASNPLMLTYRTADGRFVALTMLASDRYWAAFCRAIGEPERADDPRFADESARRHARACVEWLDGVFAARDLDHWRRVLAGFPGEWAPVQVPGELHDDPQVRANGYIAEVDVGGDVPLPMVTVPVQFDEQPSRPARAPEHGEHTESVLEELGLSWDEIGGLKDRGAIL